MYLKQYHISRQISQNHGRDHSEYVDPAVEREIIFWESVRKKSELSLSDKPIYSLPLHY